MSLSANYQDFVMIAIRLRSQVIKTQSVVHEELSSNHGRQRLNSFTQKNWNSGFVFTSNASIQHVNIRNYEGSCIVMTTMLCYYMRS